jgi:hypothetical protein
MLWWHFAFSKRAATSPGERFVEMRKTPEMNGPLSNPEATSMKEGGRLD